ncbi:iron-sulfur cluster assembly protein [Trujillonella humicola]|uniref:iron-sulfur cluster assembly protein n=1 Tax=Trujillonella humicola TaxID=3383699 RepID=UPI0039062610
MTAAGPGALEDAVRQALGTVLDPELDEPITDLDFVASCTVSGDGVATVRLRLPTFFCAPNFSFLMVADAYDAVSAVDGVTRAEISLEGHHASGEINLGVAAHAGFVQTFAGEADAELDQLRRYFLEKAVVAGQDRVARPLVDAGAGPAELVALTLGSCPASVELDRLRARRAALGLPAGDDDPLLVHPDGSPVDPAQVPLHLRRARLTRLGIEANGGMCRSFLATRYGGAGTG